MVSQSHVCSKVYDIMVGGAGGWWRVAGGTYVERWILARRFFRICIGGWGLKGGGWGVGHVEVSVVLFLHKEYAVFAWLESRGNVRVVLRWVCMGGSGEMMGGLTSKYKKKYWGHVRFVCRCGTSYVCVLCFFFVWRAAQNCWKQAFVSATTFRS